MTGPSGFDLPARTAVRLVAAREFRARVLSKTYLIGLAFTLAIIGASVVIPAVLAADDGQRLGLVDRPQLEQPLRAAATASDLDLTVTPVADRTAATSQIEAGTLDAALVADGDGARLIVDSEPDPALRTVVDTAVAQQRVADVLRERGVDPAVLADAGQPVAVTAVDPPQPGANERSVIAFLVMMVLVFQLLGFGSIVAFGVVEEKSSRVVEILLSTIRPWQLLLGKVIGIGAGGLLQLALFGAVGLGVGSATGALTLTGTAVSVFAGTVGWFVLGYLFFALLYAAAGALVSRQEDLNAVTMPMTVLIMLPLFLGIYAIQTPGEGIGATLAWVPPMSIILMPIQQASGEVGTGRIALAAGLMVLAIGALVWLAGRIYSGAVLRIGSRVSIGAALRAE